MLIGLPRETKPAESRVALTPASVDSLIHDGHRVMVQAAAGIGSGFPDDVYARVGAQIVPAAADAWAAELVVKVNAKDPLPETGAQGNKVRKWESKAGCPALPGDGGHGR